MPHNSVDASPHPHRSCIVRTHEWLYAHKLWATLLFVCLLSITLALALHSRTDNSTLPFFPDTNPKLLHMAEALHMAPFSRLILLDFYSEEHDASTLASYAHAVRKAIPNTLATHVTATLPHPQAFLRLLPALTTEKTIDFLENASKEDVMRTRLEQNQSQLGSLLGSMTLPWIIHDPLHFRSQLLQRLPSMPGVGLSDPNIGLPRSADNKHVLLVLRPTFSMHDVESSTQLMQALDAAIAAHVPSTVTTTMTGAHRHSATNTQIIDNDIQRILIWSLLGFAAIYAFFVRSIKGGLWLLITPALAALLAWGSVSLVWPVIAGLALGFGASVLGIAEDYAMHMHFALRHASARNESTKSVLAHLSAPLIHAFLLNGAGFAVLLFSAIPALRQLAGFALCTLAAGLFLALVVLPLCPGFATPPIQSPPLTKQNTVRHIHLTWALLCVFFLGIFCTFLWLRTPISMHPQSLGANVSAMQKDGQYMQSVWGKEENSFLVIRGNTMQEVRTNTAAAMETLQHAHISAHAISTLWPSETAMTENIARWKAFVQRNPTLMDTLTKIALEQGFTAKAFAPFAAWFTEEPRRIDRALLEEAGLLPLLTAFLEESPDAHNKQRFFSLIMLDEATQRSLLPTQLQDVHLSPKNVETTLTQHLQKERMLFPITALVCALLLFFLSPCRRQALLATIPPLAALTAILLAFAIQDIPLTLASLAALPLVLGLAIDHGIILTHELSLGRNYGVQRAILASSLTAMVSMGLLMLAEHPALHSMGQIIVWGLMAELPVALWILPRFYRQS